MVVINYVDPITGTVESPEYAGDRAVAQRMMEKVFLPHHPHVVKSCPYGNISSMWAMAKTLCVGSSKQSLLNSITEMVSLVRAPPTTWPPLAAIVARLALRLDQDSGLDKSLHVGPGLLPEFLLRALQHSNFDYLRLEVQMLHKVNNSDGSAISLPHIIQDMGVAHSLSLQQADNVHAFFADPAPTTSTATCFHFEKHGTCRWGDKCRYSHTAGPAKSSPNRPANQLDSTCLVCGSKSHGIQECPKHKEQLAEKQKTKRKAKSEAAGKQRAALAKMETEMAQMRAYFADKVQTGPPPPDPAAAVFEPQPKNDQQGAEIQRLRTQLAAQQASQWDQYSQWGPGYGAGPGNPGGGQHGGDH